MPVFIGTTPPNDLCIGATPVKAVFIGATPLWNRAPLSVSVSSTSVSGSTTTNPVLATAIGGSGSYTYLWQRVSGPLSIHATHPAAPLTAFERLGGMPATGTWRCRVSDGSQTAFSPDVLILLNGAPGGVDPIGEVPPHGAPPTAGM